MEKMFPEQPKPAQSGLFQEDIVVFSLGEPFSLHVQPQCDLSVVQKTSQALSLTLPL